MSANDLRRRHRACFRCDDSGGAVVEFAMVAPMLFLLIFGALEFGWIAFQWNLAAKATHLGARAAVVSDPVAQGIKTVAWNTSYMGQSCQNADGTTATDQNGVAVCPTFSATCVPNAGTGGNCGAYTFSETAFTPVFQAMTRAFPAVRRENIRITYSSNGLGFVGRPGGLPVTVTVSLDCINYNYVVMGALLNLGARPGSACGDLPAGVFIPASTTSLTAEDLDVTPISIPTP